MKRPPSGLTRAQAGSLARAMRELDWKELPGGDVQVDLFHPDTGIEVTVTIRGKLCTQETPVVGFKP